MAVQEKTETQLEQVLSKPYVLVINNDDHNSFDWVIECLMNVCKHEVEQATQCAYLVHFKGKADAKYGDYETISTMKEKLTGAGILATMEEN